MADYVQATNVKTVLCLVVFCVAQIACFYGAFSVISLMRSLLIA